MKAKISDVMVERLMLGELPEDEAKLLRDQLDASEEGRQRLAQLEQSNIETLKLYAPADVAREVRRRDAQEQFAGRQQHRRSTWLRSAFFVAPALSAMVLLVAVDFESSGVSVGTEPVAEIIYAKGDSQLVVHRLRRDTQVRLKRATAHAVAGDRLQIGYRAGDHGYGLILSIDGRAAVTMHLADDGDASSLVKGDVIPLTHSYQLDDAPDFERFFLVTADTMFTGEQVRAAAKRLANDVKHAATAPLDLPEGLTQVDFTVRKDLEVTP